MNALLLSTWFPFSLDNGSSIRAYYLLQALASRYEVTLVTFFPEVGTQEEPIFPTVEDGIKIHRIPVDPFRHAHAPQLLKYLSPSPLSLYPSQQMQQTVDQLTRSRKWDVVVAIQLPVAQYTVNVNDAVKILDIDASLSFQLQEHYLATVGSLARLKAWASWQKARRYESRMARQFEACCVASPLEIASVTGLVENNDSHVEVIPNGVDCQRNRLGLAVPSPYTLIYNGALTYGANYDAMNYFLADIYPLIKSGLPTASLTITGSTKGVNLNALSLDESVHFTGFVDDIRYEIARASVCVVPIRRGGGTRLKILEAMALGVPVVATTKGAEGLDVIGGEHILLADDADTFTSHTLELLSNRALRDRLSTNARRLVEEKYDWSRIGRLFVEMIETAARPGRQK